HLHQRLRHRGEARGGTGGGGGEMSEALRFGEHDAARTTDEPPAEADAPGANGAVGDAGAGREALAAGQPASSRPVEKAGVEPAGAVADGAGAGVQPGVEAGTTETEAEAEPAEPEAPEDLRPVEIVRRLDEYIVGQAEAKRSVAIALRNRVRRLRLPEEMRQEVLPKNILMIGPTGV